MGRQTIAVVFGGGHVSSWQAGLKGAFARARRAGCEVIAFDAGFDGANHGRYFVVDEHHVFADRAGCYFGSSRAQAEPERIADNLVKIDKDGFDVKGIVGFCGNDHLAQLYRLHAERGLPVAGWPKTMDNDLSETYFCLGFQTAAVNAAEAVRRGIDCAVTNGRIHLITMFGRYTDWVVAAAGGFGGADVVVGGEAGDGPAAHRLQDLVDAADQAYRTNRNAYGRPFAVVAVAEGATIEGLGAHVDADSVDAHGHLKIEPEKLALALKGAFRAAGLKGVSTDTLTYNELRNAPPTRLEARLAEDAGAMCVESLLEGRSGECVVVNRCADAPSGLALGTRPLPDVFRQRFLRPEGYMDYNAMTVTPSFIEYYRPVLGTPTTVAERVPRLSLRQV